MLVEGIVIVIILILLVCVFRKCRKRRGSSDPRNNSDFLQYRRLDDLERGQDDDFPTRDLHGHSVKEAKEATWQFLEKYPFFISTMKIITGRVNKSKNRKPILKPVIKRLLPEAGPSFKEADKGGSLTTVDL